MNWGAIGIVILMVVLYLFIVLFPRRPKYFYSDKAMLREDAEIIRVGSFGEGSRKERRIRTVVVFDIQHVKILDQVFLLLQQVMNNKWKLLMQH